MPLSQGRPATPTLCVPRPQLHGSTSFRCSFPFCSLRASSPQDGLFHRQVAWSNSPHHRVNRPTQTQPLPLLAQTGPSVTVPSAPEPASHHHALTASSHQTTVAQTPEAGRCAPQRLFSSSSTRSCSSAPGGCSPPSSWSHRPIRRTPSRPSSTSGGIKAFGRWSSDSSWGRRCFSSRHLLTPPSFCPSRIFGPCPGTLTQCRPAPAPAPPLKPLNQLVELILHCLKGVDTHVFHVDARGVRLSVPRLKPCDVFESFRRVCAIAGLPFALFSPKCLRASLMFHMCPSTENGGSFSLHASSIRVVHKNQCLQ